MNNISKPIIIVYAPTVGIPPVGGPELYIANTLKGLAINFHVHLYVGSSPLTPNVTELKLREMGVISSTFFINRFARNRYIQKLRRLFEAVGVSAHRKKEASEITDLANSLNATAIWVIFGNTSFQLIKSMRLIYPSVPIVLDTDSVWSDFVLRSINHIQWFRRPAVYVNGKLRLLQEQNFLKYANSITAVSKIDQSRYQAITHVDSRILVKSNVIDLNDYEIQTLPNLAIGEKYLCITGTFGHRSSSMDMSTQWFVETVWPIVRSKRDDLWLYIVGKNADFNWSTDISNHIKVYSDVESTVPYLANSEVIVVPLLFESGTRFKILEAGALSKPVVSTSLGAEVLEI